MRGHTRQARRGEMRRDESRWKAGSDRESSGLKHLHKLGDDPEPALAKVESVELRIERFEASVGESANAEAADWAEFAENVRRNRAGTESKTDSRWMGVVMMVVSLAALGWGVWKFALHGRLIP